ncbi:MAG TPA: alkaline phosphatase [Dictyoglomaceae bacterium]|nr:alkaline phosphatase [Dictyoglomaceae bacterium]HOL39372.1 alkaline phosphatase [Dictyoglomaceae bacterium]HPP15946.1 alkaline phosphatase [Dictyoglomaceae bacterium]
MSSKVRILILTALLLCFLSISFAQAPKLKNVIFFIGDGMGLESVDLSRIIIVGKDEYFTFETAPYIGIAKTFSANSLVTDSAAAGTALATGFKTNNSWLGTAPDEKKIKTLLEAAKEVGKSTGLITTVTITHATPAAFAAHTTSRDEIPVADQYAEYKTADIYMGGGLAYFLPKSDPQSKREDNRNLIEEFKKAGYEFISTPEELDKAKAPNGKLLGLFAVEHLPYYMDREFLKVNVPDLAEMTEKALDILSKNPKGFFLMVEGGKIDWANHVHDAATAAWEVYEFNEAIRVALDFINENPDTLIVITADHETGGIGLSTGKYEINPEVLINQKLSCEALATLVKGKKDDEIKQIFEEYVEITDLKPEELQKIKKATAIDIADVISARAQVGWTTTSHSGVSVPVYAFGESAELFAGVYDNTDIAKKIAELAGYTLSE